MISTAVFYLVDFFLVCAICAGAYHIGRLTMGHLVAVASVIGLGFFIYGL